jgi:hypothetical protein
MSIECDTSCLFGVIRLPPPPETIIERGKRPKSEQEPEPVPEKKPLPENLDERGKQPKSEPEPEEKQKPVQKRREKAAWELKALEDLTLSDFSMYDDVVKPFSFACTRFKYSNKAMIKKEKEIKAASADYIKRSRNLSVSNNLNLYSDFEFHSISSFTYNNFVCLFDSGRHYSPLMRSPLQK